MVELYIVNDEQFLSDSFRAGRRDALRSPARARFVLPGRGGEEPCGRFSGCGNRGHSGCARPGNSGCRLIGRRGCGFTCRPGFRFCGRFAARFPFGWALPDCRSDARLRGRGHRRIPPLGAGAAGLSRRGARTRYPGPCGGQLRCRTRRHGGRGPDAGVARLPLVRSRHPRGAPFACLDAGDAGG